MIRIGAIGHRDLKQRCKAHHTNEISKLLVALKKKYSDIMIYSPLSDGADRLIVEEAIKVGIEYIAILPMPEKYYIQDFDIQSKKVFNKLKSNAKEIITLPLQSGGEKSAVSTDELQKDIQYELAGHYIIDECDAIIALWDQKHNGLKGGTSETLKYYLSKNSYDLYFLPVSRDCEIHNNMVKFRHIVKTIINYEEKV